MALERTNGDGRTVASGATGMGLMAMVVAYERAYEERAEIKTRILKILEFLENCERHKGAWAHWYNGDTYQTQPFSSLDDGGDLVETSFVVQALITLRNYFRDEDAQSVQIRQKATLLWEGIDWN
ncbi:beta-glucosidase, partial [Desulfonatronum sp. SC1]